MSDNQNPPNTISDAEYRRLQERAQRGPDGDWLTKKSVERRRASEQQRRKAGQS